MLKLALLRGLRPAWALASGALAIVGGSVLTVVASDPLWLLAAVLAVLLIGATRALDDVERRASVADAERARADLLEHRCKELGAAYRVSQAQYKVLEDWQEGSRP